ncbi:MAG: putative toxin-antitoxin system toxin component, PIN family [Candidatus Brocadiales bacterium]
MLKVVYDTNVVVSGLLNEEGIPASLLDLALQRKVELFLSPHLLEEYKGVLTRSKFGFSGVLVSRFLVQLKRNGVLVEPETSLRVLKKDPDDNRILECALEAKASYIITGNIRHFPFKRFRSSKIVSPTKFWEVYKASIKV